MKSLPGPPRTGDVPAGAITGWQRLGTLPAATAVITALSALYMLLVGIGNVTDYGTNFAFVQHVLAMDTTNFGAAPGTDLDPDVMWRAITSPVIQTVLYLIIIAWEWADAAFHNAVLALFGLVLVHYEGDRVITRVMGS